jgi:signal transduction histidine kinase
MRVDPREGLVALAVEDDGPGIPPDRIEEAFQPFVRLESSRSQETGGIGLGLAVARSIARAHGGNLTLANRPDGGLRADILLPSGP